MGSRLVRQARVNVWPRTDVSDAARVVLVEMCDHAHDNDAEPVYFGGWQLLAIQLGYCDPEPGSAAQRKVTRAIRELVRIGVVSPDPRKPRHYKRRYRLNLPGP